MGRDYWRGFQDGLMLAGLILIVIHTIVVIAH